MADLQQMLTRLKILTALFPPLAKVITVDENFESPPPPANDNLRDNIPPAPGIA
jgi:hypothetical protein